MAKRVVKSAKKLVKKTVVASRKASKPAAKRSKIAKVAAKASNPAAKKAAKPAAKAAKRSAKPKVAARATGVKRRAGVKAASAPRARKAAASNPRSITTASLMSQSTEAVESPIVVQPVAAEAVEAPVRLSTRERAAGLTDSRSFAIEVARLCKDDHCEDVIVMDARSLSQVTDYIVVASGTSDRQMRSVLRHVEELGAVSNNRAFRTSADDRATWLIADFVHVVVHLFEPHTRTHYDLEMLWGDAPRVDWERADQIARDRAGATTRPAPAPASVNS